MEAVEFTESLQHLQHLGVFVFGQKINLKVEVVSPICLDAAPILTHKDKEREENRFERNDHRQKRERKRVEGCPAVRPDIQHQPNGKPGHVKANEPHTARLCGDGVTDSG